MKGFIAFRNISYNKELMLRRNKNTVMLSEAQH